MISSKCKPLAQHERHESKNMSGHGSQYCPHHKQQFRENNNLDQVQTGADRFLPSAATDLKESTFTALWLWFYYVFNRFPAYRCLSGVIEINRDAHLYQFQLR